MPVDIFKHKFKRDPKEFKSTAEVNAFIEGALKKNLEIKVLHPDLCSSRGNILPFKDMDADKIFKKALKAHK